MDEQKVVAETLPHIFVSLFISILWNKLGKRKIRSDNTTIQEAVMWHMIGPLNARRSPCTV